MHPVFLASHNVLRWIILILAGVALVRAYFGWLRKPEYTDTDRKVGVFFSIAMDIQLLLGLILYIFLSPITRSAFRDFSAAMAIADVRFFAADHIAGMILAVILVHVGTILSKRAVSSVAKHRHAAIWYSLAVLVVLFSIPWWRPLFPGLG